MKCLSGFIILLLLLSSCKKDIQKDILQSNDASGVLSSSAGPTPVPQYEWYHFDKFQCHHPYIVC